MQQSRRNFILSTGAALVGSTIERAGADAGPGTSAPDITSLLQAAGFNPAAPGAALMAVIGDVHINFVAQTD